MRMCDTDAKVLAKFCLGCFPTVPLSWMEFATPTHAPLKARASLSLWQLPLLVWLGDFCLAEKAVAVLVRQL